MTTQYSTGLYRSVIDAPVKQSLVHISSIVNVWLSTIHLFLHGFHCQYLSVYVHCPPFSHIMVQYHPSFVPCPTILNNGQ